MSASSPSPPQERAPRRIAVVGGGISGLSAAYFLSRPPGAAQVTVFEASSHWGGIIVTEEGGGFVMEGGPDSFLAAKPEAAELCRQLGLRDELMETRPSHRRSYTWWEGSFYPLPTGILNPPIRLRELAGSPLLSPQGRERAAREPEIPAGGGEDESVGDFFHRRFGREVVRRIAEPLLAGVFGGGVDEISMQAAFPRLCRYEQLHGCLCLRDTSDQAAESREAAPSSPFLTLRGGLATLVEALLRDCRRSGVELRSGRPVQALRPARRESPPAPFLLDLEEGEEAFDAVVMALPAPASAKLLAPAWPDLADALASVDYSPAVLGALAYSGEVPQGRPGSGFIIPPSAGRDLLACTWVHQKWRRRAPRGHSLLRGYLAGEPARRMLQAEDAKVISLLRREFLDLMDVRQDPVLSRVWKLPQALPVYRLGHRSRMAALKKGLQEVKGLTCIGNYLDGVGLPDCIRQARQAARALASDAS
ncbi:MAG TPA: protoporphyrinogen oxidase [Acidobacteriota bacterium]|nr:protoporphyrinogen oxidase [Acidobacteriota bacterium]